MREMKSIRFNTEEVRAILDGIKTQTRRIIKPPFEIHANGFLTKPTMEFEWIIEFETVEVAE